MPSWGVGNQKLNYLLFIKAIINKGLIEKCALKVEVKWTLHYPNVM